MNDEEFARATGVLRAILADMEDHELLAPDALVALAQQQGLMGPQAEEAIRLAMWALIDRSDMILSPDWRVGRP